MGVKEELEELRRQNLTKAHKADLDAKTATGAGRPLSTPEDEEAALKAEQQRARKTNYTRDAQVNLQQFNEAKAKVKVGGGGGGGVEAASAADRNHDNDGAEISTAAAANDDNVPDLDTAKAPAGKKLANDSDDDDVPDLEEQDAAMEAAAAAAAEAAATGERPHNRAEKKARKMMQRLGMRPVGGVARATLKTSGNAGYFAIENPDVYEKNGTYVIFGEALQGGAGAMQQQAAMQQAKAAQQLTQDDVEMPRVNIGGGGDDAEEAGDAVDESGVESKDIELVMSQASCSRAKAVAALKENDGDLVNAIMSLTA